MHALQDKNDEEKMEQSHTIRTTQKAALTRQRILDTALNLFGSKGYEKTTMREIAAAADCSLGLAYRYFASKDELVLELYRNLLHQLEEQTEQLAPGAMADRFQDIMLTQFTLMTPHRQTLGAVFGPALNPQAATGVFSASTADVRQRARDIYIKIVAGSKDAPRGKQSEEIATILYGIQLALTLFWLQDLSPEMQKTTEFIVLLRDMIALIRPLLRVPVVSRTLVRLVGIVGPMLGVPQEGR